MWKPYIQFPFRLGYGYILPGLRTDEAVKPNIAIATVEIHFMSYTDYIVSCERIIVVNNAGFVCLLGVTHAQRLRPLSLYSLVFSVYMSVCATTPGDGNKGNDCILSCFTLLVLSRILQKLSGCPDYSGFSRITPLNFIPITFGAAGSAPHRV